MSDVHNPVDIEQRIEETKNRIAKGVSIVTKAEETAKALRTAFDKAYAKAYLEAEGSIPERKYKAVLDTIPAREAAETAECAFHFAERTAQAVDKELFAWQSISKSVVAMFGAVKHGS